MAGMRGGPGGPGGPVYVTRRSTRQRASIEPVDAGRYGIAVMVRDHPFTTVAGEPLPALMIFQKSHYRSSDRLGLAGLFDGWRLVVGRRVPEGRHDWRTTRHRLELELTQDPKTELAEGDSMAGQELRHVRMAPGLDERHASAQPSPCRWCEEAARDDGDRGCGSIVEQ